MFGVPLPGSSARLLSGNKVSVLDRPLARGKGDDAALRVSCRSNL
jgi:hypothetical protein